MQLSDLLSPRRIKVPLTGATQRAVIEELVNVVADDGLLTDRDQALRAVLEREQAHSTAIGSGLAVPHAKTGAVGEVVLAAGKSGEGVEFDSADGRPVTVVLLLLSPPDKIGPHIRALALISRLATSPQARDRLLAADDAEALFRAVTGGDRPPPAATDRPDAGGA